MHRARRHGSISLIVAWLLHIGCLMFGAGEFGRQALRLTVENPEGV